MHNLRIILKFFRVHHWIKNILVFAPLIFSENLLDSTLLINILIAFVCFCLLSSSAYIVNDIIDLEADRKHPRKKTRPIAAGLISIKSAAIIAVVLIIVSLAGSFTLQPIFGIILIAYLGIEILYSLKLKGIVILDAFCIAAGFVLRVAGGVMVIGLSISESNWLFICAGLLALLLAFSKRRSELLNLGSNAPIHRKALSQYNTYYLDQMMLVTATATLITYVLYVLSAKAVDKFGSEFALTIPFVVYGLFRYQFFIYQETSSQEDPIASLLSDKPLLVTCLLWIFSVIIIIYLR